MTTEIFFFETETYKLSAKSAAIFQELGNCKKIEASNAQVELTKLLNSDTCASSLFFIPLSFKKAELMDAISKAGCGARVFWVGFSADNISQITSESLEQKALLATIIAATSATRNTGVKSLLEKGSTIFSGSFFSLSGIGYKLDPFFHFARSKMGAAGAINAWSGLHAAIFTAFQNIPGVGESGTGERVDIQIGADSAHICASVRFDYKSKSYDEFLRTFESNLVKKTANYFEVRAYLKDQKVEISSVHLLGAPTSSAQNFAIVEQAALETSEEVKDYHFKDFQNLATASNSEIFKIKAGAGFKKKFSEHVKAADFQSEDPTTGALITPTMPGKSDALLESKIETLESTLKQREELIEKLNKEIAEIKDPLKMGVISNIKDNQSEGLKDNIKRLEKELADANEREKELISVADKAIASRDDAVKKNKDFEIKLKQATGGTSSKVQQLEKQLEQTVKANKDLTKRVSQLVEQVQASGKRVA